MPITRRDLLAGGVSVAAVGAGYGWFTGDLNAQNVSNATGGIGDALETPDPNAMEQDLSNGFEQLVWHEDGRATIQFDMSHYVEPPMGFAIFHESKTEITDDIQGCLMPQSGSEITIPLVAILRSTGWNYPSRRFVMAGADGSLPDCTSESNRESILSIPTELYDETWFTVPERFRISTED